MSRYAKPARADQCEDEPLNPLLPNLSVDDHEAVDTGLIWATGEPIMRMPNPIGFGRDEEW